MLIYCINLAQRTDRWAHIQQELDRVGITALRIDAVDGRDSKFSELISRLPPSITGSKMSPGAYGCLQSHRNAWQQLLESGEQHCVILEDDIKISDDFSMFCDAGWISEDVDVIKFETWGPRVQLERNPIIRYNGREIARLLSSHIGSGAYLISRSAAGRALRMTEYTGEPIDEMLFNSRSPFFQQSRVYQISPAIAIQGARTKSMGVGNPGWASSSISDRNELQNSKKETKYQKIRRRISEEIRAIRLKSRYVTVPFR